MKVGDYAMLRLHCGYKLPAAVNVKLSAQLAGPFKILERIGKLAYRLQLPDHYHIHDVISIAHLEPVPDPTSDPYRRRPLPPPPVTIGIEEEYEVERLLVKRRVRKGRGWSTQYLVRWLGYDATDDMWITKRELQRYSADRIAEFEARHYEAVDVGLLGV